MEVGPLQGSPFWGRPFHGAIPGTPHHTEEEAQEEVTREELVNGIAEFVHSERMLEAGKLILTFSKADPALCKDEDTARNLVSSIFYWCLNAERYDWAAKIAWDKNLFHLDIHFTRLIWKEVKTSKMLMLMGSASTSKSYAMGVWLLLDWVRDPEYTNVSLVGPSEDHLRDNLFSHLVTLHQQASIPLPGITGDLFIGLDTKKRNGCIRGVVIPLGKRPAGRLQGRKRKPRKGAPHPVFGRMSRMRIFLDEFEKIPSGVWKDIDNVVANLTEDPEGFKLVGAFNPEDPFGNVAVRCEPVTGWEGFDPDKDEVWTSKRNWRVVRLDAAKSENVVARKELYPGLQTYEGFQAIVENSGGTDSPGYWTMARACFPRTGAVFNVIPSLMLNKSKGEFIFIDQPTPCGGVDVALEGSDTAEFAAGLFGQVVGIKHRPNFEHPDGWTEYFVDESQRRIIRYGLQVNQIFPLVPGDTVSMAKQIMENSQRLGIAPEWLLLDRTGNGAGVHDLLKGMWSQAVLGVNFSESATDKKILEEDTKPAKEVYKYLVSEVWFALKKFIEFDLFKMLETQDEPEVMKQMGGRRYAAGKLTQVESKPDYKSRGNKSPNKADAVTLLVHVVRLASGLILSGLRMKSTVSAGNSSKPVCRVDVSNRYDDLEADY